MTSISRVERPSLLSVNASVSSGLSNLGTPPDTGGTTQQRHQARVSQQYALAQYAANQQFAERQNALYPDGNLPSVRSYLRDESPPPPDAQPTLLKIRELAQLRSSSVLTDAEFATAVSKLVSN